MGLFSWILGKKEEQKRHTFDDDDREISKLVRKKQTEIKLRQMERDAKLQELEYQLELKRLQADIDELDAELSPVGDAEGDDLTTTLVKIFGPALAQKFITPPVPAVEQVSPVLTSVEPPPQQQQGQHLSDEQLKELWSQTPKKYKLAAANLSDENVKLFIKKQLPDLDEDSLARALSIIRAT